MQLLKFTVNKQILRWINNNQCVISESRGHVHVAFELDPEWAGLAVTATFENEFSADAYSVQIGAEPVAVPPELLIAGGLRVSLTGLNNDGSLRLTTKRMDTPIRIHRAGALVGIFPPEVTPDLWEQALAQIGNLSNLDTIDKSSLVSAINEVAKNGGSSAPGNPGKDGITPHIGANGNWYIGETDTGVKAQGEDGVGITDIQKRVVAGRDVMYITLSDGTEKGIALPVPENGKDYVLTDADKAEIAELAADLVDVPEGSAGGGYVAQDTAPEDTSLLWVDTSDDSDDDYQEAVNAALAQAKASGEFDGKNGDPGAPGKDGKDYVLTDTDRAEIAELAAQMVIDDAPVKSVNGKTGAVTLAATDVGADPKGTANTTVSGHNTNTTAHNDIRLLITALATRLDALANSDDETLDQMAEVVAYIKANRDLIEQVTTGKVNVTDIINNLTTNVSNKPLSAAQGVALKALIDALDSVKLNASELTAAINTALAQAKASGEFDGQPGKDGTNGKDGQNGQDGEDGVGIATIKQTTTSTADGGNNVFTVTLTNGQSATFTVKNGSKGSAGTNGKDGTTPAKGTDYFTAADKAEMVNAVIAALPVYAGEVS